MGLERFVRVNLVLVPTLIAAGYLLHETEVYEIPMILFVVGVAYVTFAALIIGAWALSRASMSYRS